MLKQIKYLSLLFLLAVAPLCYAQQASQVPSEEQMQALAEQMNDALLAIRQMGGAYLVCVEKMPLKNKTAITKAMSLAAQSEHCCDFIESAEGNVVVFKGPQGSQEAQTLVENLAKLDCEAELIEIN